MFREPPEVEVVKSWGHYRIGQRLRPFGAYSQFLQSIGVVKLVESIAEPEKVEVKKPRRRSRKRKAPDS